MLSADAPTENNSFLLMTDGVIAALKNNHEQGPLGYEKAFSYWCATLQGHLLPANGWFSSLSPHSFDIINQLTSYQSGTNGIIVRELLELLVVTETKREGHMRDFGVPIRYKKQFYVFLQSMEALTKNKALGVDGSLLILPDLLQRSFALMEQQRQHTIRKCTDNRCSNVIHR